MFDQPRGMRELRLYRIETPVSLILLVPIDPEGVLPPAPPLLGILRCRCDACQTARRPQWIRIPPLFLRRLILPGPEQAASAHALVERYPWLVAGVSR
jgi:hypothetical protein